MDFLKRVVRAIPYLALAPFAAVAALLSLAICDLLFALFGRRRSPADTRPRARAASVVIPNWNGRDLLEKYLPSVIAALAGNPANEVIVVENGSEDGSAEFVRERFPEVRLLALDRNLGFGGGSNAGFAAAKNDIVVLLNSDMRVEPDFLQPLLDGFTDDKVFAVSCQIFFSDPAKLREETGLTQGWWEDGALRVRHRADDRITGLFPCFYGGGGSCAFDRAKFLELGGFDHILAPFYLEDTDLGYLAWKRGWKVLYQPASRVFHEHRGTIGKRFTQAQVQAVLKKNYILFCWKNVHEWPRLMSHFAATMAGVVLSALFGDAPLRANGAGLLRAVRQIGGACAARWRARSLAMISDTEAFKRPLAGYFRDRFERLPEPGPRMRVLFVTPYGIYPPVHGGGVFMYQTVRELARIAEVHLIAMLDWPRELEPHRYVDQFVSSADYIIRTESAPRQKKLGSAVPHAVAEFHNADLEWLIHRQIYHHGIDVVQLEYTVMAQYAAGFHQIPSIVFEHDVYFQSIARGLPTTRKALTRLQARWEYLRALRYEVRELPKADRIQVCSRENREYLESFVPELRGRIDDGFRAGVDTASYEFVDSGREPDTMLFLGSFRHLPNQEALEWFISGVLPAIREKRPAARLVVIGSDPPPRHSLPRNAEGVELVGFVEDVRQALARYAVFICPILSGSGVRVKLLEAFASGIPVVSTRIGAEGLAWNDGEICGLADDHAGFAERVVRLLDSPSEAAALARRARAEVVAKRDMRTMTAALLDSYRSAAASMRKGRD
ncbi:MAG: glycosyltransferase [Acidobacteria bacterium]|nr:glycosyltransferase [Acidobacteriota bacterium]